MRILPDFFLAAALFCAATAVAAGKPDVVMLLADDFNPFYTGFAGDPDARTPRLDALAQESMVFTNCYTASPVCMPARTSLVAGLYPHSTGCWGNAERLFVSPPLTSLFRDVARAGYATAMIGKTHWFAGDDYRREFSHLADYFEGIGIDFIREVATTFASRSGSGIYQDHLRAIGKFDAQSRDLTERLKTNLYAARPSLLAPEETGDWMMTDLAVDYIRAAPADRPFFLMIGFSNPHAPFDPPGLYANLHDPETLTLRENVAPFEKYGTAYSLAEIRRARAAYLGKIAFLDHLAGRIVDALEKRGTWDQTIFVFTADHGLTVGEHRNISKGRFWEEIARVPLLFRLPGVPGAGARTDALAQLIDLYPTIVEAIGGTVSAHVSGCSLLPVLRDPAAEVRDAAFCEIASGDHFNYMVRGERYKWFVEDGREHLYDLASDPWERVNLIRSPEHAAEASASRERLLHFLMTEQVNHSEGYTPLADRVKNQGD